MITYSVYTAPPRRLLTTGVVHVKDNESEEAKSDEVYKALRVLYDKSETDLVICGEKQVYMDII